MTRYEKTWKRDLTYSLWHRKLEDELTFIDIDACEYCAECFEPLALIELARDVGQKYKPSIVTKKLARKAGIPAYRVFYKVNKKGKIVAFRVKELYPDESEEIKMTPEEYADFLRGLRRGHTCLSKPPKKQKENKKEEASKPILLADLL